MNTKIDTTCPSCGARVVNSNCCLRCGTMITGIRVDDMVVEQQVSLPTTPPTKPKEQGIICPNCGCRVVNAPCCLRCGTEIDIKKDGSNNVATEVMKDGVTDPDQTVDEEIQHYKGEWAKNFLYLIITIILLGIIAKIIPGGMENIGIIFIIILVACGCIFFFMARMRRASKNIFYLYTNKIPNQTVRSGVQTILNVRDFFQRWNFFRIKIRKR